MLNSEQPNTALDNLVQKLDDIDAELEIQSDYLGKIKMLLTVLVILIVPIVLFLLYVFYQVIHPSFIF